MKKLSLLKAAMGLLALWSASTAGATDYAPSSTAATELIDGGLYFIYDSHSDRYAVRYESTTNQQVWGNHVNISSFTTTDAHYVWKAIATSEGGWSFQNLATNNFIKTTAHANVVTTTAGAEVGDFSVTVKSGSTDTFTVINRGKTGNAAGAWDGNDGTNYTMAGWQSAGHPYQFYPLVEEMTEEDRSGWQIYGCSQYNGTTAGADGILNLLKDGHTGTFWHSDWSSDTDANPGHFFIVDRGEDMASTPIGGFGYLPRQNAGGNGFVTGYSVYVVDDLGSLTYISGSNADGSDNTSMGYASNSHTELAALLNGKTPDATGTWDIDCDDRDTQNLRTVTLTTPKAGRYFIFKINSVSSSQTNQHANCAEFYLYHPTQKVTATLTFKRSDSDTNPLTFTSLLTAGEAWPTYEAFTCKGTGTVTAGASCEYVLKEATKEVRIYNERVNKYVQANSTSHTLKEIATETPGDWTLFKFIPMGDDGGFAMYNVVTDRFVGNNDGGSSREHPTVAFTRSPQKFYTGKQASPIYMDWIGTVKSSDGGLKFFNDHGATYVCAYSWNDDGSKWVIVTDFEQFKENWAMRQHMKEALTGYSAALEELGESENQELVELGEWVQNYDFGGDVNAPVSDAYREKIDRFLGIYDRVSIKHWEAFTDNLLSSFGRESEAWASAKADENKTLASIEAASSDVVNNVIMTDGTHVAFSHPQRVDTEGYDGDYMGVNASGVLRRGAAEGKRAFTIKAAADGVNILHEYSNKYIKAAAGKSGVATLVDDPAQATAFTFTIQNKDKNLIGIKNTGTVSDGTQFVFLHSNSATNSETTVVNWSAGDNSAWSVVPVDATQAAKESYEGAKSGAPLLDDMLGMIGTGLGEYSAANGTPVIFGETDTPTEEEYRTSAAAIRGVSLNMPQAGSFLRLKHRTEARYMSSTLVSSNDRNCLSFEAEGNTDGTVWFYGAVAEGGEPVLVSLANGKIIGKFSSSATEMDTWGAYVHGSQSASAGVAFAAGHAAGRYAVTAAAGRYLNNGTADAINCGGNNDTEDYDWILEEVSELPFKVEATDADGAKYTTVYSPVALEAKDVEVYVGSVNAGAIEFTLVEATEIPANTPVYVKYTGTEDCGDCITLPVCGGDVNAGAIEAENCLSGNLVASAKAEGTDYYAMGVDTEKGFGFHAMEGTEVDGFKAFYTAPTPSETEPANTGFILAAPLSEITLTCSTENAEVKVGDTSIELPTITVGTGIQAYEFTVNVPEGCTLKYKFVATSAAPAPASAPQLREADADGFEPTDGTISLSEAGTLHLKATHEATGRVKEATYDVSGGVPTGIFEIEAADGVAPVIYDLQGRRVSTMTRGGVYIVNGVKIRK